MKAFEYAAPRTEADVLELLSAEPGKTEILAGGTDLMGLLKTMVVQPDRVVSLMQVDSLKGITVEPDGQLLIGAATTLEEVLEHPYLQDYPAITGAIRGINSMQLQAQGTIGGDLCQRPQCWYFRSGRGLLADNGRLVARGDHRYHAILGNSGPAKFICGSRIAPALVALGAKLRVVGPSPDEEQLLAVEDFYRTPRHEGQRENVLLPNQFVSHILLPPIGEQTCATYEVRHGSGPEYPLASAAVSLTWQLGAVRDARVVLGLVAPTPWLSYEAASFLRGKRIDAQTAEAAGEAAVARANPLPDNEYKVQLAKVAVKRAVLLAAGQETGGF